MATSSLSPIHCDSQEIKEALKFSQGPLEFSVFKSSIDGFSSCDTIQHAGILIRVGDHYWTRDFGSAIKANSKPQRLMDAFMNAHLIGQTSTSIVDAELVKPGAKHFKVLGVLGKYPLNGTKQFMMAKEKLKQVLKVVGKDYIIATYNCHHFALEIAKLFETQSANKAIEKLTKDTDEHKNLLQKARKVVALVSRCPSWGSCSSSNICGYKVADVIECSQRDVV